MKSAGAATIFQIGDMIGSPDCSTNVLVETPHGTYRDAYVRAVPLPFYDGLLARFRSAWEVLCGRAVPVAWPSAGELERALDPKFPKIRQSY